MRGTVLVTGGAGFIGSQVVRDLLAQDYQVHVLDDLSTGRLENLAEVQDHPRLKVFEGSILNQEARTAALQGVSGVMHLAVSNLRRSLEEPLYSNDVNATGTLFMLESCRKMGIQRFIYTSSSEVFGSATYVPMDEKHPKNPCTIYASAKLVGEHYCVNYHKLYGMNATVIRPFNNFGPRAHFDKDSGELIPRTVVRLLNGLAPIIFGTGQQTRDFIHVSDTSIALIKAFEAHDVAGEIFNVGYGQEQKILDVANRLCELIAPSITPDIRGINRPGDVTRHFSDSTRFREKFAWQPKTSFSAGLESYVNWFKVRYEDPRCLLQEVAEINW